MLRKILVIMLLLSATALSQTIKFGIMGIGWPPHVLNVEHELGGYGWTYAIQSLDDLARADLDTEYAGGMQIIGSIDRDSVRENNWTAVQSQIAFAASKHCTIVYLDDGQIDNGGGSADSISVDQMNQLAGYVHQYPGLLLGSGTNRYDLMQWEPQWWNDVDIIFPYDYGVSQSDYSTFLSNIHTLLPDKKMVPFLGYSPDIPSWGVETSGYLNTAESFASLGIVCYWISWPDAPSLPLYDLYKLTNFLQTNNYMSGAPAPVGIQLNQKLQSGSDVGSIGVWNSSSFVQHAPGDTAFLTRTSTQTIQADESVYSSEKYNNWTRNSVEEPNILNYHQFTTIEPYDSVFTSHFIPTAGGDAVQANDVGGTGEATSVGFSDPWFVDSAYQSYGSIKRNQGTSAPLISRASPFYPNMSTSYGGDYYNGVFLNQNPNFLSGVPTYTVSFPSQSVTVGGTSHNIQFINWTASGATLQNTNSDTTALVFTSSSAAVTANVKAMQLSNDATAYSRSSRNQFIRLPNGHLYQVYTDGGHVWLEYSTDNGQSWALAYNGPLDGTAGGKDPSIAWDNPSGQSGTYVVGVVWEQQSGTHYDIRGAMVSDVDGSAPLISGGSSNIRVLFTEPSDAYSVDANPEILMSGLNYVVVFERQTTSGSYQPGVNWMIGTFTDSGNLAVIEPPSQSSEGVVSDSYQNGVAATAAQLSLDAEGENSADNIYAYIIFQLGTSQTGSSDATVITAFLSFQYNGGYWTLSQQATTIPYYGDEYDPSIVSLSNTNYAACWINNIPGNENGTGYPTADRMIYFYSGTPSVFYFYGDGVQSCALNLGNSTEGYCGWSQIYNNSWSNHEFLYQNGSPVSGDLVTLNTTGKYIQLNNGDGSDIDNTYISSFSPFTEPYSFALTPQLNTLIPKTEKAKNPNEGVESTTSLVVGRGCMITDGKAGFSYQFNNLNADGQNIAFVSAPDKGNYRKMANIDSVFETQPFQVNPNSKIVFSDWSGFSDSSAAVKVLGDSGNVGYRVEVLDNATNNLIGTIKNVDMTSSTLHGMERNAYLLNTDGISGGKVRIKVSVETNLDSARTAQIKSYSFDNTALNSQTQSVSMEPVTVIKSFALSQNYPNPFNPTTTISYSVPKESHVTLSVYDVLGQEVETLVNEDQNVGRYEVQFNGSRLASGVYFYRLVAGTHVITKKMLMLK